MSLEHYLPEEHLPHAKTLGSLYADAHAELARPFPSVKLPGYPAFNAMTGGFRPYEFSILCGSTGTGKTTLCANWSRELISEKVPHYVASVETGHTDYIKRVMSAIARRDWNTGEAVPIGELKRFHGEHGQVFNTDSAWLSLYDNRVPVETLMSDVAWMVRHHGIKVAIIDNFNFFVEITSARDSLVESDRVTHELIVFCKAVPVHIVMVMHPRKTDHTRVESEFEVKGSSTAVQEAHNVFLFNRPHPDLIQAGLATEFDREIKIAKMRRMGKYVRRRLILKCQDGVSYSEGKIV